MMIEFYYPKTQKPCGVEDYTRNLEIYVSKLSPAKSCLVLNFPLVAWKKVFFAPIFKMICALLKRQSRLVMLHEWKDLDWKRRWFLAPNALLATHLAFSSPYVREEFEKSFIAKFCTQKRAILPIISNMKREMPLLSTHWGERIKTIQENKKFIIGHFGSIYARKQSLVLLDIAAQLKAKGINVCVVFMGSFVKSGDNVEELFNQKRDALGLQNDVLVTGFLPDNNAVFDIAQHVNCFIYTFEEGLTSRRSSVLAAAQSGKPVLVPQAKREDEFAHHTLFQRLIDAQAIQFIEDGHNVAAYVAAIAHIKPVNETMEPIDFDKAWGEAANKLITLVAAPDCAL